MPSNWLSIDTNFPTFTGDEPVEEQVRQMQNYLYIMKEQLQYSLNNLTMDNWNATALQDLSETAKGEIGEQLQSISNLLSQMSSSVDNIKSRISAVENISGRVGDLEDAVFEEGGLVEWVEDLDNQIGGEGGLTERVGALEETASGEGGHGDRLDAIEEQLNGETGIEARLGGLEESLTGEEGLAGQVAAHGQQLQSIGQVMKTGEEGDTIGTEGKPLYLVGQIYINGVLYGQEESV